MNSSMFDNLRRALLPSAMATFLAFSLPARGVVIGHWLFNEGSGAVALDSSGQGNHGSILGGASYTSTPGTSGISLDGIDDFVNFGRPALFDFTSDEFSVEVWVAIDGTQTGNSHGIFGKGGNSWLLGYEHGGGASARHNVELCGNAACSIVLETPAGSAQPFGQFKHVAITKSTFEALAIYVDGVEQSKSGGTQTIFSETADVAAGRGSGNFLECIIDEIRLHDVYLSGPQVANLASAGPDNVSPTNTPPGRLNNLVTELLSLDAGDISSSTQFQFPNARDGWVFVSSTVGSLGAGDSAHFTLPGPPLDTLIDHQPGGPLTLEAMRWLDTGDHTLTLQTQGSASVQNLIVRAIPELMMWRYVAGTQLPQQVPVWDWANLRKHILPSVNTISAIRAVVEEWRPQHQAFIDEWNAEGRRWTVGGLVPAYEYGPGMTTQQAYNWWASHAGCTQSDWAGIVIDEFSTGDFPDSQYTQMQEALEQLTSNFPGKLFYAFTAGVIVGNEPGEFMRAVVANKGAIAWEWYEREEPNEASAQAKINGTLSLAMQQWRDFIPGAPAEIVVVLGYYSTPPFSLNENPAVDYKVWMDMQFHQLANDPRFDGLRGIMEWNTKYTDEEVFRWQAALYRHYGIEGNTGRLSDLHGFTYNPGHLVNPDFDQGTTGWTIQQAPGGATGTDNYSGLGRLQGRVRGSTRGDNYLWMRRSSQAPNRAIQTIAGLTPGNLYTMKLKTMDREDFLNGVSAMKTHAVQIGIDNVEIAPGREFQQEMKSETGGEVNSPFSDTNQPWINYYWRLFRANGTTATLTMSDWASDSSPGGPIGEELMFNFIEVQPYFPVGDEFASVPSADPVISQLNRGDATGLCFTGEVGNVYSLYSADQQEGPFTDTGAGIDGTGGIDCLFDPGDKTGIDSNKFYEVRSSP
jgi:hypothetical protein